jgi:hypothetical protein
VFVVDGAGDPVTGTDVAAHFSSALGPDTVRHQHTDLEGLVEFLREYPATPLHVKICVRDESFGPYPVEEGTTYTVVLSGE